jgi:3-dehydroquinate synthase
MIDASVGGKTGVNWGNLKNQVGTFYPANEVILDFNFLKTLPEKEMKSGYAELIKMMIIKERDFFNQSFAYIEENLQEYLLRAVKYKLEICSEDFTDMGRRQVLNLGHTYAHLLESVSDFRISHGDAVAEGLRNVLRVSLEKGILSEENDHKILMYMDYLCNKVELTEGQRERIEKAGGEILRADKKDGKIILASDEGVIDSYLFKIIKIVLDKKSHLK